ncbi:hypothetical protein KSP40_PGU015306 [Platanthera guangdongensis]|uniref:Uncharacterized protein ycf68 n=1 Tax=Platanthera guangdongensis TaxID=2320717 RepID=A0ABR2LBV2_9ASPA
MEIRTFYSLVGSWRSGGPQRLLYSREMLSIHPLSVYGQLSLEHRLSFSVSKMIEKNSSGLSQIEIFCFSGRSNRMHGAACVGEFHFWVAEPVSKVLDHGTMLSLL